MKYKKLNKKDIKTIAKVYLRCVCVNLDFELTKVLTDNEIDIFQEEIKKTGKKIIKDEIYYRLAKRISLEDIVNSYKEEFL